MRLFNWFKCKPTEKIRIFEKKTFNIGVTEMCLTFQDGHEFIIKLYGYYNENALYENLVTSKMCANRYITNYYGYRTDTMQEYINDVKNPTVVYSGIVIKKEILETKDYYEEYRVEIE